MQRPTVAWMTVTAAAVLMTTLASCSRTSTPPATSPADTRARGTQTLIVSVAASTTEAIEELCERFQDQTGVGVKVNAGPSNGLATQILEGAPADLFLSASREWANKIDAAGQAAAHVDILTNRLVVVVPRDNPAGIRAPEDLTAAAVKKLALAGENVPAGAYAGQALAKLGLLEQLNAAGKIVRGQDVRAALSYVERGEAEAGIVYATDGRVGPSVTTAFEFDSKLHDEIVYVLVLIKHESENKLARQLYDFLRSGDALQEFAKRGFIPLKADATENNG